MPRQPFLPQHKGKHFCFDGRGLEANVEAASLIGRIIASWSRVEHQMAMIMAAMLGDSPAAGVALFTTLRNARAQREAMSAVESAILSEDTDALLEAILCVFISIGKERHVIAHSILGWSFDLPGPTLSVDSSFMAGYEADAWNRFNNRPLSQQSYDKLEENIKFYTLDCLGAILSSIEKLTKQAFYFYCIVRNGIERSAKMLEQLVNEPRIAQEITRILQDKKNNQTR